MRNCLQQHPGIYGELQRRRLRLDVHQRLCPLLRCEQRLRDQSRCQYEEDLWRLVRAVDELLRQQRMHDTAGTKLLL